MTSRIVIYDRNTAEILREATKAEANLHYAADSRDDPPLDGATFDLPGRQVWIDIENPTSSIVGWTPCGIPVFLDWPYRRTEARGAKKVTRKCTAAEVIRFACEPETAKDEQGHVDGTSYGAAGARVLIHYQEDWGLPPQPIIDAWRARYFTTSTKAA